jgi:methylmalonyl-CoA epimerase
MINKIDHIGIAVKDLEEALILYTQTLGLSVKNIEIVADQKVRTAIIPVGESKIELLEATEPDGVIAQYIAKKGEGLHHIALAVDNIEQTLAALNQAGLPLIDKIPRRGVENTRIAFIHPKATKILLELVESSERRKVNGNQIL